MSTYKENYETNELKALCDSILNVRLCMEDESLGEEETKNLIINEFSVNPRLRDYVKYKFMVEYNIVIKYDKESIFIEKVMNNDNIG